MRPSTLLDTAGRQAIVAAIRRAEQTTSAEIRVHIESRCPGPVLDRAVAVFEKLGMRATAARNGVLIYVGLKNRASAIIGDKSVNEAVRPDFWSRTVAAMNGRFAAGSFAEGILGAIAALEGELAGHFPVTADDRNELPDDISFEDDPEP